MFSHPNPNLLHAIYTSRLMPGEDYRAFGAVCRTARAKNLRLGVGGVLLFDGERFCQWLYGPADVVNRLLTSIALDRRHGDFKLLYLGDSDITTPNFSWCSGFVPAFALDVMDSKSMGSVEVMPAFKDVLATADLQPNLPLVSDQTGCIEPC